MSLTAERLAKYTLNFKYEDISEAALKKAKQHLLDTLGCAFGGYDGVPSRISHKVMTSWGGSPEATVIGTGEKIPCANAAFINGVMVRYLDFNDSNPGRGHPSENIPAVMALGEMNHISGKELITSIVLGYEVGMRLSNMFHPVDDAFDNTTSASFCTPFIAGRLLGLDEKQIVNAVGVSASHNLALSKAFRSGSQVTMIKGMGYAFGVQSAIAGTLLAKEGVAGPDNVIELFNALNGETPENLEKLMEPSEKLQILRATIKPYASEYMAHSPVEALLTLLKGHPIRAEEVEEIKVISYDRVMRLARPETYKPATREKADHSLPYCMAVALMEGDLWPEQFERGQWEDPKVLELMSKVTCVEDPEMTKLRPKLLPSTVEVRTKDGQVYSAHVDANKGTPANPMSDEELQNKFRRLARRVMDEKQAEEIIQVVYGIEAEPDITKLSQLLVFEK